MAPPYLLSLPTELLLKICSNLCLHCTLPFVRSWDGYCGGLERQNLKSLSVTCRRLRDIAQPILFHTIRRGEGRAFMQLITTRPELAALPRHLSFDDYYHCFQDISFWEQLGREVRLLTADQSCLQSGPEGKIRALANEVLLSMLPNLQSFETPLYIDPFVTTFFPTQSMYSHLAQRVEYLSPEPALPSLRTLTIARSPELSFQADASVVGPLTVLLNAAPNLHRLRFMPPLWPDPYKLTGLSDAALQKLQVLDFLHYPHGRLYRGLRYAIHEEYLYDELRTFAKLCPRLREVNISMRAGYEYHYVTSIQGFSTAKILESLSPAAASLRRIDIDASNSPVWPDPESLRPALAELVSLEKLSLDEQCFCHHRLVQKRGLTREEGDVSCITEILPQTVRHLSVTLTWDTSVVGDIVQLGAEVASGKFCNLERVDVVIGKYGHDVVDLSDVQRDAVLGAFRGTNVRPYIRRIVIDPYIREPYW